MLFTAQSTTVQALTATKRCSGSTHTESAASGKPECPNHVGSRSQAVAVLKFIL